MTPTYECSECKASGVKLWRPSCLFNITLHCAGCLGHPVDKDGKVPSRWGMTDQVAGLVPAVPCDVGYWGYTSVPPDQVAWWRALPSGVPDPFSEGSHAFEAGRGWYACPYEYNTHEWERWHAGYASALGRRP